MKTQLILLATPIIVSNDAVKEGEWCIEVHNGPSLAPKTTPKFTDEMGNTWWLRQMNMNCQANDPECKKVIAGLPKLPSIDFNGFEEQLGIIDVNKLAKEKCKEIDDFGFSEKGFIEGFKAAQKLNDKKFGEKEVTEAVSKVLKLWGTSCINIMGEANIEFLAEIEMALSKSKVFDIEIETEKGFDEKLKGEMDFFERPKITDNSVKILKVL